MLKNKNTTVNVNNLLNDNNVNARVTLNWGGDANFNCKFLPGDRVMVSKYARVATLGKSKSAYRGKFGRVIAASTPNGHNLVSDWNVTRGHTNYYVAFRDGSVRAFESYLLK